MKRRIRSRRDANLSSVELVEERCLLSAITVTSNGDTFADDGEVTLREAIQAANTNQSVDGSAAGSADEIDVISFADGISSVVLTGGQFEISESVTISGPEVRVTLDADQGSRHFEVVAEQVDFTVENLQFINGFTAEDSEESGGVIRVDVPFDNGGSLTVINSIFDSNEADSHGGAIHVGVDDDFDPGFRDLYTITLTDSVFSNNISGGSGGGVLVTGNTFTRIEGSTFSGNSARRQAGGIMVFDSEENTESVARAEVIGSTFTNNESFGDGVVDGNGGGFNYFGDGSVLVEDSVFTDNTTNFGGGIRLNSRNGETQIIRNSVVSGNHARVAGGGIAGDVLEITNTIVENNTSAASGGGIVVLRYDSTPQSLILRDSVVRGNQSSRRGGGVATDDGTATTVTVTNSEIVGNQAISGGGGIDLLGGTFQIVDTLIADNTATSGLGGGIYAVPNADGGLEVIRTSVIGNESTGFGGGLYFQATRGPVVVANSTFAHNRSGEGGGIYARSAQGAVVSLRSTTIARNHSDARGGGLFVQHSVGQQIQIESSILSENTSGDLGLLNDFNSSGSNDIGLSTSLISVVDNSSQFLPTGGTADADGNVIGTQDSPIDAGLTYAGQIGGSHTVIGLLPTSPAIDTGSNSTDATLDSRGAARVQGGQVDMGAFEGTPERYFEITSAGYADSEADSNGTTTVTVVGAGEAFAVDFETANRTALAGEDYEAKTGTLTFDGTDGQEEEISILVLADDLVERDEMLELSFTLTGDTDDLLVPADSHLVNIEDQDVGVQLHDDELFVAAADGDDTVLVELVGTEYQVSVNGETELFDQASVRSAFVRLGHGDNNVDLSALWVPAEVLTGDGNDTVLGTIANDVISVGAGDDVVDANAGRDRVDGGPGNDTLNGDRGSDTIFGGEGDDLLTGRGSIDFIYGSEGLDTINGGGGADRLFGGLDADLIQGGAGSDQASGGDGDDTLIGGSSFDTLFGEAGNDRIEGGKSNDSLNGGAGDDTLMGFLGNDTIYGGDGDDFASGGEGRDSIEGDAGNDSLLGGVDSDTIHGGDGNDSVVGGGADDTLWGEAGDDSIRGGGGDDSLLGHDGNDTLRGEAGNDQLTGEAGDDVLLLGDGDDSAFGGEGNDLIKGEAGNDLVRAEAGDDTIDGGLGDDQLSGGDGHDRIEGGEGRDVLIGGHGRDTLRGNEGDDILVSSEIFTVIELLGAEWSSTERSYEVRATNIRGGAQRTDDRLNAGFYLRRPNQTNSTIFEDIDAGDVLRGGDGMDYFFASKAEGEIDRVFKEAGELFARL